jgi:hypothetical protein
MNANGQPIDLSGRIEDYYYDADNGSRVTGKAKKSLTAEEVATYTIKNVLSGSDNWQPQATTEKTAAPQIAASAGAISWSAVEYAICYVVYADGKAIGFTTEASYTATWTGSKSVTVRAVSENGALSEASNALDVTGNGTSIDRPEARPAYRVERLGSGIRVKNVVPGDVLALYALNGQLLATQTAASDVVSLQAAKGVYVLRINSTTIKLVM